MKKATIHSEQNAAIQKVKKDDRKTLTQLILQLTEQKIQDRFSDKILDRENEKIKLIGGSEITINEVKKCIAENIQPYSPMFTNETEFYSEIYRLNNWCIEDANKYYKKPIVGKFTNDLIYHRFSKEILPMLQHLNPYVIYYIRKHKHFQLLTTEAKQKLEIFIEEAVEIMKSCDTWYDFRVKYFEKCGVPFQMNAFEDTNKVINEIIITS